MALVLLSALLKRPIPGVQQAVVYFVVVLIFIWYWVRGLQALIRDSEIRGLDQEYLKLLRNHGFLK